MGCHRRALAVALITLAGICLPAGAAVKQPTPRIGPSILGMPSGPWPFVRPGPQGLETYLIPKQLPQVRHFPEPERSTDLALIREHQANLSFLDHTAKRFFTHLQAGRFSGVPEYARDLHEVLIAVDFQDADHENPLYAHEPLLAALPPYTRVLMFVPEAALARVKSRLAALGLADRVKTMISGARSETSHNEGVTRWIRDIMFVAEDKSQVTILSSLAHKEYKDVVNNDLGYLGRITGKSRHVLRMPIFLRGGNVLEAEKAGRKLLFIGEDELEMNRLWFDEAFAFTPPGNAVPDILKAVAGVDEVVVLPNSRTLFHIDTFIAPLGDGQVALLNPGDPALMAPGDRRVLVRTRETLQRLGFNIVPIPTSIQRMEKSQSPVNIVSFTDHRSGLRRALVPQFPEAGNGGASQGLNNKVLAAYRSAGIDPIPVEDRYSVRGGNVHCAVVPLH